MYNYFLHVLQIKYQKASKDNYQNFSVVTDTPVYVTAVQSGINASDVSTIGPWSRNGQRITDSLMCFTIMQFNPLPVQRKYKEDYEKNKEKYTTVLETVDYDRTQSLKDLFSHVSINAMF